MREDSSNYPPPTVCRGNISTEENKGNSRNVSFPLNEVPLDPKVKWSMFFPLEWHFYTFIQVISCVYSRSQVLDSKERAPFFPLNEKISPQLHVMFRRFKPTLVCPVPPIRLQARGWRLSELGQLRHVFHWKQERGQPRQTSTSSKQVDYERRQMLREEKKKHKKSLQYWP